MSSSCRTSLNLLLCLLSSEISLFEMSQIRNSPFTACACLFLALRNIFVYYLCLSLFIWSFFIYSWAIMGVYRSLNLYFQVQPYFHISSFFSWLLYVASAWYTGNHRMVKIGRNHWWGHLESEICGNMKYSQRIVCLFLVRFIFCPCCLCHLHLAYASLFFWNHTADRQVCLPLICFVNFRN